MSLIKSYINHKQILNGLPKYFREKYLFTVYAPETLRPEKGFVWRGCPLWKEETSRKQLLYFKIILAYTL